MRHWWVLLTIVTAPASVMAEPEPRLKLLGTLDGACPNAGSPIVFSPNGQFLAFVGRPTDDSGYAVMLWDLAKRAEVGTFPGAEQHLGSPVFSPDGKTLAAAFSDQATRGVRLWDIATKKEYATFTGGKGPLAFSPDGKTLASGGNKVEGREEHGLKLWDMATRKEKAVLPAENETRRGLLFQCVAFSADSKYIATASGGVAKDGQHLGGAFQLWDTATGAEKAKVRDGIIRGSVAFSPNGKCLATADWSGNIFLWDVASGKWKATLQESNPRAGRDLNSAFAVAFSSDGKTLAAGTLKGLRLWNVTGDNNLLAVDGPDASVWSVAFSPDGKTLATAGRANGASGPNYETSSIVRLWQCLPAKEVNK